jgi:hypothetical protein
MYELMVSGNKNSPEIIADFQTLLNVCHTVIPNKEEEEDGETRYDMAKVLEEGAEHYDYKFTVRNQSLS